MKDKEIYFITGTDTGVGKTIISLLMMQFFMASSPFYLKPFQTGCPDPYAPDSDAQFIYRHVRGLEEKDPAESVVFCFKNPKAPLFAARDEGRSVDMDAVMERVRKKLKTCSPLIVEGAGGVLVPVTEGLMIADAIKTIGAKPIVVARAGLGTINHTLLTVEVMRNRHVEPFGIILVDKEDPPTPEYMVMENIEAIEHFSGVLVGGVIGRIDDFKNPGKVCYAPIERLVYRKISK